MRAWPIISTRTRITIHDDHDVATIHVPVQLKRTNPGADCVVKSLGTAGKAKALAGEWGEEVSASGGTTAPPNRNRGPPRPAAEGGSENDLYDSVTGTEGHLQWAAHPRLSGSVAAGEAYGRQYVVFLPAQAYPELVLHLERRPEKTALFAQAQATGACTINRPLITMHD